VDVVLSLVHPPLGRPEPFPCAAARDDVLSSLDHRAVAWGGHPLHLLGVQRRATDPQHGDRLRLASGGGLSTNFGSTTTLNNCTVRGNSAAAGGGISNQGTLNVSSGKVLNNQATSKGGGSTVKGNKATTGFDDVFTGP
jgi:hypothetical protein